MLHFSDLTSFVTLLIDDRTMGTIHMITRQIRGKYRVSLVEILRIASYNGIRTMLLYFMVGMELGYISWSWREYWCGNFVYWSKSIFSYPRVFILHIDDSWMVTHDLGWPQPCNCGNIVVFFTNTFEYFVFSPKKMRKDNVDQIKCWD